MNRSSIAVLVSASVLATFGASCAAWTFYLEMSFIVEGSIGTQDFLIGAVGTAVFGAAASLGSAVLAISIRSEVSGRTVLFLTTPLVLNVALAACVWLLNLLAYP